ncbi:hypothetical protein [Legionella sp. CNM-4043-24]|uniref:hypothetical protein n=1 Tax=Legionella sp. CNM-4043-24 TaxID=3421646 RepID=UPI00403AB281
MSIKRISALFLGVTLTPLALALPPEVIGSCKNNKASRSIVTISSIPSPLGMQDDNVEPGCVDHFENTTSNFIYGFITCNNNVNLIIKNSKYDTELAENHSVNPNIGPGGELSVTASWWKIEFNDAAYLCIDNPLSSSGQAGNVSQYYIVENAFNSSTPIIHYYFFDKEITPIDSIN